PLGPHHPSFVKGARGILSSQALNPSGQRTCSPAIRTISVNSREAADIANPPSPPLRKGGNVALEGAYHQVTFQWLHQRTYSTRTQTKSPHHVLLKLQQRRLLGKHTQARLDQRHRLPAVAFLKELAALLDHLGAYLLNALPGLPIVGIDGKHDLIGIEGISAGRRQQAPPLGVSPGDTEQPF